MISKEICVDFDGVIHSYERGWQTGEIYGTIIPGFFEWAQDVAADFKIVIYSSRSANSEMNSRMENWLWNSFQDWCEEKGIKGASDMFHDVFRFTSVKPAAFLTIDDRAICFKGDWYAPELKRAALLQFKPWNYGV